MKADLPYMAFAVALSLAACRETPVEPEAEARRATPSLAAAAGSWLTRANMPSDRFGVATVVVSDAQGRTTLYAIGGRSPTSTAPYGSGGFSTVQAYNSATNTWTARAPLPHVLQYSNGAVAINGKIYVSGGATGYKNYSDKLLVYDPAANTWTEKQPMPRNTFEGTSAAIDGKLYVLSSCHQQEDCWNPVFPDVSFYRYTPPPTGGPSCRTHRARIRTSLGWPERSARSFTWSGGAYEGDNVVEVYDPATNAWSTRASMGSVRSRSAGVAVNGKLYVIAGYANGRAVPTTSVYDPATNAWKNLTPAPFTGGGRSAGRVVVDGQVRIDVVGGPRPGNNRQFVP